MIWLKCNCGGSFRNLKNEAAGNKNFAENVRKSKRRTFYEKILGNDDGNDDGDDDGNDNESIESINDKKYRIINNPNDSNIIIESKSGSSINVKVYNLKGILLNEKDITDSGNIELNNTKGIHIIQITEGSNNLTFSEKVIKY